MKKNRYVDWSACEQIRFIPETMKQRNQWVCWKLNGSKKIPYDAISGRMASCSDRGTWTDYQTAVQAAQTCGYDGIGYEICEGEVGIDLDHCYSNGKLSALAQNIIERFTDTYVEVSQSGSGVHILCFGKIPCSFKTKEVEIYGGGRYIALTGAAIFPNEPKNKQSEIDTLWNWLNNKRNAGRQTDERILPQVSCSLSAREIIDKASRAKGGEVFAQLYQGNWQGQGLGIGDGSQSAADLSFCNKLAFWTGADAALMQEIFKSSGLFRTERKMMMAVNRAIRDCAEVYQGKR